LKKKSQNLCSGKNFSRRNFISTIGAATAGIVINSFSRTKNLYALSHRVNINDGVKVAVTEAINYDRTTIRQKVQHLFESLGGISDVIHTGDKVALKINITGGMGGASPVGGEDPRDCVWTHPEVIRAVGELILDSGVSANNLYIVEALWDMQSYNDYGYAAVQESLGAQLINLNNVAPYTDFIKKSTGTNYFYYSSFTMNRILDEIDVFISIPKMKQHYDAGVTHTMKNLVGIVPLQYYMMPDMHGMRSALHYDGGNIRTHLPRSICDLNLARPIHLGIIDGIKNAVGGEGPWNPTFQPAEYNILLAGKDPVALDSIASYMMGNDPEAEQFILPGGERCDNYLKLAGQLGMGTNILDEIQVVSDGAVGTSARPPYIADRKAKVQLFQKSPNPFNHHTIIRYYLPRSGHVTIKIYNSTGRVVETLVSHKLAAGEHQLQWSLNNLPDGIYFCKLQTGDETCTIKLLFNRIQK
jgi:uncharacterized protein (DUF362 family)